MSIFVAVLLGIVQGITEFIPVSSSGHLVLVGSLVDLGNHFVFDVLLNIGTLAALCWYTRHQILTLVRSIFGGSLGLLYKLILATIPGVTVGFLFDDFFENLNTNTWIVVIMLLGIGIVMLFVSQVRNPRKSLEEISYTSAALIGVAQVLALVPGTSRSGVTILAALLIGFSRQLAAEWSFMMAIPIVLGASLKTLFSQEGIEFVGDNFGAVIAGNIASFVVGLLAIDFLFKILKSQNLRMFGIYRIGLAGVLGVLLLAGII